MAKVEQNPQLELDTNLNFSQRLKAIGPAAIIAAAIIGPGTVTTASVLGATYRYESLWIVALACIFSYYFQEPAIRITVEKRISLLEGVREYIGKPASIFLYVAILFGGIAFQAGNFIGAGMALDYFLPGMSISMWALIMSLIALIIGWLGVYKIIENINIVLILLMVLSFVITAFVSGPSLGDLVTEGFSFSVPGGDYWLILALLATTMPPNIVLALSAFLKKKYEKSDQSSVMKLLLARFDLRLNMIVTALITAAIVICAGAVMYSQGIEVTSAHDMAKQLTPLLGRYAGVLFALGLWAAAISSGLYHISLQPLLMNQAVGLPEDYKATRSRIFMVIVSIVPVVIVSFFDKMPVAVIITAQALNGLALPFVVGLIWLLCNNKNFLQSGINNTRQNIIYGIIMIAVTFLAIRVFLQIFKII